MGSFFYYLAGMQAILFIGVQASGKSSFYKERFFNSHVRISMDLLRTRNKEKRFLQTCYQVQQRFVVDNTNPTREDRERYIQPAKAHKYEVIGYYFQSRLEEALERNALREGKARIPDRGVRATHKKLEMPDLDEGFDQLFFVKIESGNFHVSPWNHEV